MKPATAAWRCSSWPPIRRFKLDVGRVAAFADLSRRPTVLLIHGNSSNKGIFSHQLTVIRRLGLGLLVPDLPGHGSSDDARTPKLTYNVPGYAGVIQQLLDQLALPCVHVVGWSLGGHVGLELLAIDRRVRSLMIAGAPPVTPGPSVVSQGFLPVPAAALAGKRLLSVRERRVYAEHLVGGSRHLTRDIVEGIRRTDGRARYWMVKSAVAGVGTDEVRTVRTCPQPLAVVHGRQDPFVNGSYLESLKYAALWRGRVEFLNAGHAPHWERPRLFNRLMKAFLTEATIG